MLALANRMRIQCANPNRSVAADHRNSHPAVAHLNRPARWGVTSGSASSIQHQAILWTVNGYFPSFTAEEFPTRIRRRIRWKRDKFLQFRNHWPVLGRICAACDDLSLTVRRGGRLPG